MNTAYRYVHTKRKFSAAPLVALLVTLIAPVALPGVCGRRKVRCTQHPPLCNRGEEPGG